MIDKECRNRPLKENNDTFSDDSDAKSGNLFLQSKLLPEKSDEKYYVSSKYE